jgi:Flp pilus assembly pilin Flp
MRRWIDRIWREDDGVLSFEWTLLTVVVVFGIVGGLAAARDTIIDELGDTAEAIISFDQSFSFAGIPALGIMGSVYVDPPGEVIDCDRQTTVFGIDGPDDGANGA